MTENWDSELPKIRFDEEYTASTNQNFEDNIAPLYGEEALSSKNNSFEQMKKSV